MNDIGWLVVWNVLLLVGTGYVVFGMGHSGWWFLLAVLLMASSAEKE